MRSLIVMEKRNPSVQNLRTQAVEEVFRDSASGSGVPFAVAIVADENRTLASLAHGPARLDDIFAIASMTKPVTSAAALQLVERGVVDMDEPVHRFLPEVRDLPVLEGFDGPEQPRFSSFRYQVTLRQLLNHTAGFAYPWNHPLALRYGRTGGMTPFLVHEPGTLWQYGISIDWVGRLVEKASGQDLETYFQENIFRPLGMTDTSFLVPPEKLARLAATWQRTASGSLVETPASPPPVPLVFNGGGGLYSTALDYIRFLQMILHGGVAPGGKRILAARTVHEMGTNQTGDLDAGRIFSVMPERSQNVDFHRGGPGSFGFGFLINRQPYAEGRAAGSLSWAGIRNTFFWVDPSTGIAAVLLMQFMPFCDSAALGLLRDFEGAVYASLQ